MNVNGNAEASYTYLSNGLLNDTILGNKITVDRSSTGLKLTGLQQKDSDGNLLNDYSYGYEVAVSVDVLSRGLINHLLGKSLFAIGLFALVTILISVPLYALTMKRELT